MRVNTISLTALSFRSLYSFHLSTRLQVMASYTITTDQKFFKKIKIFLKVKVKIKTAFQKITKLLFLLHKTML